MVDSCPDTLDCYCKTYGMCSTNGQPPFENEDDLLFGKSVQLLLAPESRESPS